MGLLRLLPSIVNMSCELLSYRENVVVSLSLWSMVFIFITAAGLSLALVPLWCRLMQAAKLSQPIRAAEVAELQGLHLSKGGTPTMGGVPMIASMLLARAFLGPSWTISDLLTALPMLFMAALGGCDDIFKVFKKSYRGVSGTLRFYAENLFGMLWCGAVMWMLQDVCFGRISVPFAGGIAFVSLAIGIPLAVITMTSCVNAVNLTDGMDGLAPGLLLLSFLGAGYLAASASAELLSPELGTMLAAWCFAAAGACLGFVHHNRYPAKIFMGDVGSAGLGALLATVCIMMRSELLLLILGGVYVVETASVIVQVFVFKRFGWRLLRCSPLHHHFELSGYCESKVVPLFWLAGIVLTILAILYR